MKKESLKSRKVNTVTINIAAGTYRTRTARNSVGSDSAASDLMAAKNGVAAEHEWMSRNGVRMSATAARSGASMTGRSLVSNTTKGESDLSCLSIHSHVAAKGPPAAPRQQQGSKRQGPFRAAADQKDTRKKKPVAQRKTTAMPQSQM